MEGGTPPDILLAPRKRGAIVAGRAPRGFGARALALQLSVRDVSRANQRLWGGTLSMKLGVPARFARRRRDPDRTQH